MCPGKIYILLIMRFPFYIFYEKLIPFPVRNFPTMENQSFHLLHTPDTKTESGWLLRIPSPMFYIALASILSVGLEKSVH